jgi:ATP-binding cassette, subfamily B, bacterial
MAQTGAGQLYEASLFVEDYLSFLDVGSNLAEKRHVTQETEKPVPPFRELAADSLTFSYPGSSRPALQNVSVTINAGQVIALVGENGSGKTTLAKLLAQLYEPTSGHIWWDGVDTATYDREEMRKHITIIFQDFTQYRLSARENVALGDHGQLYDSNRIRHAACLAGADSFLSELPEGYETTLGKEFFGGVDLSIGQWQRVALARAFFRDAPFVILDEPTAALDARAEYELFQRIRALLRGRTVLLISHRFSTVRRADRIYVLHKGELVEQGTHEELMTAAGRYSQLFRLQADSYSTPR